MAIVLPCWTVKVKGLVLSFQWLGSLHGAAHFFLSLASSAPWGTTRIRNQVNLTNYWVYLL